MTILLMDWMLEEKPQWDQVGGSQNRRVSLSTFLIAVLIFS